MCSACTLLYTRIVWMSVSIAASSKEYICN